MTNGGGSGSRAAAGAIRLGNAVGAAFTNRRVLEPIEARLMIMAGLLLLGIATVAWFFPRVIVYPLIFLMIWIALALFYRAYRLKQRQAMVSSNTETVQLKNPE
jgi:cardiolipin synthase